MSLRVIVFLQLAKAGAVAGCLQAIAGSIVTIVYTLFGDLCGGSVIEEGSRSSILLVAYLLTALGLAMTDSRVSASTTHYLRLASHRSSPDHPRRAAKILSVQLLIAAVGFAVLAVGSPPPVFAALAGISGCASAGSAFWGLLMSVAFTAFATNGRAAMEASR